MQNLHIVGVDRVSLTWACEGFERDERSWSEVRRSSPFKPDEQLTRGTTVQVRGATAFVGVSERPGRPPVAKLELNPSRVGDGEGWSLAPVSAVGPAVRQALVVAGELVQPPAELGAARVRRLDVARDFGGVESVPDFLRAQASLRRSYARLHLVHSDPARSGAQTLMVGSRSGGVVRGYDKHAEKDCAPEGTVRFEVEARSWAENYGAIRNFGDLSAQSVYRLARDRWEWSHMGDEVAGLDRVVRAVVEAPGLSNAQKNGLLGFLVSQAAGAGVFCSQRQAVTYRKWQKQLGLVGESFDLKSKRFTRLDWESGQAVTHVA